MPTLQEVNNEISLKTKEYEEIQSKLHEMRSSDKNDKASQNAYSRAFDQMTITAHELNHLRGIRADLKEAGAGPKLSTIDAKKVLEADPVLRFVRAAQTKGDGRQGLEADEIRLQSEIAGDSKDGVYSANKDFIIPIVSKAKRGPVTNFGTSQADTLIPTTTQDMVVEELQEVQGALSFGQTMVTPSGEVVEVPVHDDTAAEAELISELTSVSDADIATPSKVDIGAYTFSSKRTQLSKEAISDSTAINLIGLTVRRLTRRLAVAMNKYATIGTGTNQPQGILSTSAGLAEVVTANSNEIKWDDLVDLVFSVKRPYLMGTENIQGGAMALSGGQIGFMMNRSTYAALAKLQSDNSLPIFLAGQAGAPGLTHGWQGWPMSLMGFPVVQNDFMPGTGLADNQKAIIFGNGSYFLTRISDGIRVRAYDDSISALKNSISVFGHARFDSRLIDGSNPVESMKVLKIKP